ncbi:MAG: Lrp/AsnC family transcriptional regulator [Candidatus Hydrogenedentota bacterium]
MDKIDKKLLFDYQKDFQLCRYPFKKIADKIGISENEVIDRIKKLKQKGYIKRFGVIIDLKKCGFKSTLCAVEVPPNKMNKFISVLNDINNITHNYLREGGRYNCWFTLQAKKGGEIKSIIRKIERLTGIKIESFPPEKVFKISAIFTAFLLLLPHQLLIEDLLFFVKLVCGTCLSY